MSKTPQYIEPIDLDANASFIGDEDVQHFYSPEELAALKAEYVGLALASGTRESLKKAIGKVIDTMTEPSLIRELMEDVIPPASRLGDLNKEMTKEKIKRLSVQIRDEYEFVSTKVYGIADYLSLIHI